MPSLDEIRAAHGWKREYERYLPLSRYVFRPIGFWLSWLAIHLGLTAEAVSWLSAAAGVLGLAGLMSPRISLVGAGLALLLLFNLLDCVDGSIARAMGTGNPYGRFLDSVCGAVVDLGFWAAVGIAAFRHPSLLAKPESFGHGPFLWLVAAWTTCLLAAYLGQLERSFDELVRSDWVRLQTAAPARPAAPGPQPAKATVARRLRPGVREVVTNLRVRETQYVLLAVAAVLGVVDLLVVGYLGFYLILDVSLLAVYARRGRQVRGGRRAPASSA